MPQLFSAIFLLALAKTISFILNFDAQFVTIWRPVGIVNPTPHQPYLVIIALLAFFYPFNKKFKMAPPKIQKATLAFLCGSWLFQSLFTRKLHLNFSYLHFLKLNVLPLEDFLDLITVDALFDAPYIVPSLIYFLAVYLIAQNFNLIKHSLYLYFLPFFLLNYTFTSLNIIFITMAAVVGIFAITRKNIPSPLPIFALQNAIFLLISLYLNYSIITNRDLFSCVVTISFLFLWGIVLMGFCHKSQGSAARAVAWLVPTLFPVFLYHSATTFQAYLCLYSAWFFMASFAFVGNLTIPILFILAITKPLGYLNAKAEKFVFNLLIYGFALYYLADGVLLYKSGLRLSAANIKWLFNMNNVITSIKTGMGMTSPIYVLLVVMGLLAIALSHKRIAKGAYNNKTAKGLFLIILLYSQLFTNIIYSHKAVPTLVKDPIMESFKGIRFKSLSKNLPMEQLEARFKEVAVPVRRYGDKEPSASGANLIQVTLESVHWRYVELFGPEATMPELGKLRDRLEIFSNFYSNFPESSNGDFSSVSGLYSPNRMYVQEINAFSPPTLVEELHKAGYHCACISSGSLVDGNALAIFAHRPFEFMLDFSNTPGLRKEDCWLWGIIKSKTVDMISEKLQKRHLQEPFYLFYRTIYPHSPFPDLGNTGVKPDFTSPTLEEPYKAALRYLDQQLVRLVREIDAMGLQRETYIALVTDHGELLGEEGGRVGHGSFITPQLTSVPFILIRPDADGLRVNNRLGSQVDVPDTLLEVLKIEPSMERYSQGQSLISEKYEPRPVYISSPDFYGVVEDDHYFLFDNGGIDNAQIYKVEQERRYKPYFQAMEGWGSEELEEKYQRVKKFYQLQSMFLDSINP